MLADFWRAMEIASLESRLSHVRDQALGLPQRAVAAYTSLLHQKNAKPLWVVID
jgi:hypothetical protein